MLHIKLASLTDYLKTHAVELFAWTCLALTPIQPALLTVVALVFVDLILGVLAAKKRGEPITSHGFRRTVAKLFAYLGALVLGFIVEVNLLGGAMPLVKIVGGWIGLSELKSVAENLRQITGLDLFAFLIQKLNGAVPGMGTPQKPPTDSTP